MSNGRSNEDDHDDGEIVHANIGVGATATMMTMIPTTRVLEVEIMLPMAVVLKTVMVVMRMVITMVAIMAAMLMAMDIISKEKKEITWRGLPTTRESNFDLLRDDQKRVNAQIEKKELYLKELVDQKRAIEALIERNKGRPKPELPATGAAGGGVRGGGRL